MALLLAVQAAYTEGPEPEASRQAHIKKTFLYDHC
jgi:hypothetical protein